MKIWNNLLKFMFMRWSIQFVEALRSAYRLGLNLLRKAETTSDSFPWLQKEINRLLPCPQMVNRYIDPTLDIEELFSIFNDRGIRYTVLRWFEDIPYLTKGDDVDMLVHDDDLAKIKDLFVILPTGIPCDIYACRLSPDQAPQRRLPLSLEAGSGNSGYQYSVQGYYRVPDTKHYFLSLAYHAVYHKAEPSGLPYSKDDRQHIQR